MAIPSIHTRNRHQPTNQRLYQDPALSTSLRLDDKVVRTTVINNNNLITVITPIEVPTGVNEDVKGVEVAKDVEGGNTHSVSTSWLPSGETPSSPSLVVIISYDVLRYNCFNLPMIKVFNILYESSNWD